MNNVRVGLEEKTPRKKEWSEDGTTRGRLRWSDGGTGLLPGTAHLYIVRSAARWQSGTTDGRTWSKRSVKYRPAGGMMLGPGVNGPGMGLEKMSGPRQSVCVAAVAKCGGVTLQDNQLFHTDGSATVL